MVLFMNHLLSCLFYLTASFDSFTPDTWIVRIGKVDDTLFEKYIAAYYWFNKHFLKN